MQAPQHNITDIIDMHPPQQDCVLYRDKTWTYGQISNLVKKASQWLGDQGVTSGSVVSLTLDSDFSTFICMFSVAHLGATVLTLPDSATPIFRKDVFARCGVTHLLSDNTIEVDATIAEIKVSEKTLLSLSDSEKEPSPSSREPQAPWSIVVGSGSTGKPKLLAISHDQQIARTRYAPDWVPYTKDDTLHSFVSLKFNAAKQRYLEALFCGASIFIATKETEIVFKTTRINVFFGTVFHFEKLLMLGVSSANVNKERPPIILTGGSTVSKKFRERILQNLTPNLYVLYGTNETHTGTITRLDDLLSTDNGVGYPFPDYEIEIIGTQGELLAPGQKGEVRIKSPGMVTEYIDDPDASKKYFKDGWFYPGDSASLADDGQLLHMGRLDDLMHYNGINVYPVEIEAALLNHPNVLEAYAFPISHPVHQNIPICVVRVDSNNTASEAQLQRYCKQRVGPSTAHGVFIADKIPKTARGKVNLKALKDLALRRINGESNDPKSISLRPDVLPGTQVKMTFTLPRNTSDEFKQLRNWLLNSLEITEDKLKPSTTGKQSKEAKIYLDCLFSLSEILFQLCGMPVFEPPQIVSIGQAKEDSKTYQVVIKYQAIEMLASDLYTYIYNMSFKLCSWMSDNALTDANRAILYEMIHEKVATPIRKKMPIGKSTIPVLRVAHEKGIPISHLGLGVFQLGWGSKTRRLDRSITEDDSVIASRLTHSKFTAVSLLRMAGLPVPAHELVESEKKAFEAAQRIGFPVVVKPNDMDRGEGVSVDILDQEGLAKGFAYARRVAPNKQVLVEKQAQGVCHRIFISKGRLLYAVKRNPMSVIGDGIHNVEELVTAELAYQSIRPTWLRTEITAIDDLARRAIEGAGFTLESVPKLDELVPLRRIESTQWGGVDDEVTHSIHPENLRIAMDAASIFGLNAAGVDIITSDITKPWYETGAIINEVNFAPLLGGAEISRGYIAEFLERLLEGDGKIPIETIASNTPRKDALKRQAEMKARGLRCYVTNHDETLDYEGVVLPLAVDGLDARIRAVLRRPDADALVVYTKNNRTKKPQ